MQSASITNQKDTLENRMAFSSSGEEHVPFSSGRCLLLVCVNIFWPGGVSKTCT